MNNPLSPAAKKAYEVAYAVFRIAAIVSQKALADALEQEGLHLLWNSIRDSKTESESGSKALYYLISFGRDTGIVHPENAELLIRQLEGLNFLLAASLHGPKAQANPADLSDVFTDQVAVLPTKDLFSKSNRAVHAADSEILGRKQSALSHFLKITTPELPVPTRFHEIKRPPAKGYRPLVDSLANGQIED